MKDHGQQARANENFAGPVDFETPRPDFHKPWCLSKALILAFHFDEIPKKFYFKYMNIYVHYN